jgi:D-galactarolactone cycloisomerase
MVDRMTDLIIRRLTAIPLTAHMAEGTRTSQGDYGAVSMVLVQVETADGVVGYGECLGRFGPIAYARFIQDVLAPKIIGQSAFDIRRLWKMMRGSLSGRAGGMLMECIAGIDIALWDLVGKGTVQPIHRLLGGMGRDLVDCYASSLNWAPIEVMRQQALDVKAMGFKTIKVKLGQPVGRAIEAAAAVRDAVGPQMVLGVDANWAFSLDDAVKVGVALDRLDYWFFEEPIAPEDVDGYGLLRQKLPIMLAAGESDFTVAHARELIQQRAVGLIQPDVARSGGISETRDIATLAHAFHVGYAPHVGWSGAICVAASLQLAAAMPAFLTYECMFINNPLRDELTLSPIGSPSLLVNGQMPVPKMAGLGVEINWDAVERYRVDL